MTSTQKYVLIVWLYVDLSFVVEEPFREETIDRFGEMKKVVTGVSMKAMNSLGHGGN